MRTATLKSLFVFFVSFFFSLQGYAQYQRTGSPSAGTPSVPPKSVSTPASGSMVVKPSLAGKVSGTAVQSPVQEMIASQCRGAQANPALCGLVDAKKCQADIDKAKRDCAAATGRQCEDRLNQAVEENYNSGYDNGFRAGIQDLKGKFARGLTDSPGGDIDCEKFCSVLYVEENGQRRTLSCVGSFTVSGGCLSDASIHLGSCQAKGEGVECICY